MTQQEIFAEALRAIIDKPKYWRDGQAIYNYMHNKYGLADKVRDDYGVDCFYDDDQINSFLGLVVKLLNEQTE